VWLPFKPGRNRLVDVEIIEILGNAVKSVKRLE